MTTRKAEREHTGDSHRRPRQACARRRKLRWSWRRTHWRHHGFSALALPTRDMLTEAAASGFYENGLWKKRYPRVQVLTVLEVLNGKRPDMPWGGSPFAKAPVEKEQAEQDTLL